MYKRKRAYLIKVAVRIMCHKMVSSHPEPTFISDSIDMKGDFLKDVTPPTLSLPWVLMISVIPIISSFIEILGDNYFGKIADIRSKEVIYDKMGQRGVCADIWTCLKRCIVNVHILSTVDERRCFKGWCNFHY